MPDNDVWTELANMAVRVAPCAAEDCRVEVTLHGWYATISHLDPLPHPCRVCGRETPVLTLSADTLIYCERPQLVARVAGWLAHLHERTTNEPATPPTLLAA